MVQTPRKRTYNCSPLLQSIKKLKEEGVGVDEQLKRENTPNASEDGSDIVSKKNKTSGDTPGAQSLSSSSNGNGTIKAKEEGSHEHKKFPGISCVDSTESTTLHSHTPDKNISNQNDYNPTKLNVGDVNVGNHTQGDFHQVPSLTDSGKMDNSSCCKDACLIYAIDVSEHYEDSSCKCKGISMSENESQIGRVYPHALTSSNSNVMSSFMATPFDVKAMLSLHDEKEHSMTSVDASEISNDPVPIIPQKLFVRSFKKDINSRWNSTREENYTTTITPKARDVQLRVPQKEENAMLKAPPLSNSPISLFGTSYSHPMNSILFRSTQNNPGPNRISNFAQNYWQKHQQFQLSHELPFNQNICQHYGCGYDWECSQEMNSGAAENRLVSLSSQPSWPKPENGVSYSEKEILQVFKSNNGFHSACIVDYLISSGHVQCTKEDILELLRQEEQRNIPPVAVSNDPKSSRVVCGPNNAQTPYNYKHCPKGKPPQAILSTAMASDVMELDESDLNCLAKLPVAFGFWLNDGGSTKCAAATATLKWINDGKKAAKTKYSNFPTNNGTKGNHSPKEVRKPAALLSAEPAGSNLPEGWIMKTFKRMSGRTAGTTDKYFFSPKKQIKFRSLTNVLSFIKILNEPGMDNSNEIEALKVFKSRGHRS